MPHPCRAFGCTSKSIAGGTLHFHSFPLRDEKLTKAWLSAMKMEYFKPTKSSRLCGEHFLESDYRVRPGAYKRFLKPDAVPSVFSRYPPVQKKVLKSKVYNKFLIVGKKENSIEEVYLPAFVDSASASTNIALPSIVDANDQDVQTEENINSIVNVNDKGVQTEENTTRIPSVTDKGIQTDEIIFNYLVVVNADNVAKVDKEVQTEEDINEINLRKKIECLEEQVKLKSIKISKLKDMVKVLKGKGLLNQEAENTILHNLLLDFVNKSCN